MRFIKARYMVLVMVLLLAIGGVAFCGSISGTVLDKVTQEPVNEVCLQLYKWNENNQWWDWISGTDVDDNGNFSFSDLEPGTYIIHIESCWWDVDDFFDIKKTYFPQWYNGVPGRWENKDSATQIILTDSEPDKNITVNLEPSPVSAGLSVQEEVPSQGGNIKYGVRVKNWTDHALSLKVVIGLQGEDYNGMWFTSPLSKVRFNLSGLEEKSKILDLNVPAFAADGFYEIIIEVGPSDRYPWLLYSKKGMGFEKKGATLSIVTDKEKLKEIYLKRIPKVLK